MNELISELVGYGIEKGLVEEDDKIYVINRLLELFSAESKWTRYARTYCSWTDG